MLDGQQYLIHDHEADIDSADPSPRQKGSAAVQCPTVTAEPGTETGCEMQPIRVRVQMEEHSEANDPQPALIQPSPKPARSARGERRIKSDASRHNTKSGHRSGSNRNTQLTERLYNFDPSRRGATEAGSDGKGMTEAGNNGSDGRSALSELSGGERVSDQASDRDQVSDRASDQSSDREPSTGGSDREMFRESKRSDLAAPVFHWFSPKARHISDSDEDLKSRLNSPGEIKKIGDGLNGLRGSGSGLGGVGDFDELGIDMMEVDELAVTLPLSLYRRWVRPWIRILLLLVVLWIQMMAGNVTTYFNNRKYAAQRRLGVIPRLDDVTNYFPHAEWGDPTYQVLTDFVDWSYMGSLFAMGIALIASRSLVRLAEVAWVEMLMALGKSAFMVVTTLPDASGHQKGCIDPRYGEVGLWMVRRTSTDFCGDMLFSGHTYHLLLGYIMTFRLVKDWDAKNQKHHSALIMGVHFLAVVWCIGVIASITVIRLHYTVDVLLSIVLTLLLLSHQPLLAVGVRFLYRPNPPPILLPVGATHSESSLALTGLSQPSDKSSYKAQRDPPIILLKDNALA